MSEWIRVEDRLPGDGDGVIVAFNTGYVSVGWQWFGVWNNEGVTHWMPKPEPPKEDD